MAGQDNASCFAGLCRSLLAKRVLLSYSYRMVINNKIQINRASEPAVMKSISNALYWILVLICATHSSWASNGINAIGFGAESVGMGGADLAVALDTSALNTNPAGLAQLDEQSLDLYLALANSIEIRHKDMFSNDSTNDNDWITIGSAGYAHPVGNLTFGLGLFAQGGVGVTYKNLNTAFGSQDELSSQLRIARITPGLSWAATNNLFLGASLLITYADIEQKMFPRTSAENSVNPAQSFFGMHIQDADTLNTGYKLGVLYSPMHNLRLGMAYTSKTELSLDGGRARVNMTSIGLGVVTYSDAEVSGIDQPEELGIGVAWNVNDHWLISAEFNLIRWSEAIKTSVLKLDNPDNVNAPPTINQTSPVNWNDQRVFALGAKYKHANNSVFRAGINMANNPVPDASLSPLLAPIAKYHLTLGYGKLLGQHWSVNAALEYQIRESAVYTNPDLPFGVGAFTASETAAMHIDFSRRW